MRFARMVFRAAGWYGLAVLVPMYFLFDQPRGTYEPPIPYPQAYHGFVSVAMAWQVAFLVIAADPRRLRPMMIPAVLEKAGWVATGVALYLRADVGAPELVTVVPDLVLGVLFLLAYRRTPRQTASSSA